MGTYRKLPGIHSGGSFGQWAAVTCAAPPSVIACQYAASNLNRCRSLSVIFAI